MEHRFQLPPPAWLSEHCWLCYANEERWISRFPQPGFAQLCIYYPPLKIQSPQRRGMAHFICSPAELAQTCQEIILGHDLQSCPLLFDSPPPRLFTRHTRTTACLKTSYFLIRQNLSAWVMKMLQHLLTSHQINPSTLSSFTCQDGKHLAGPGSRWLCNQPPAP